ncbi:hypothetical protein L6V77_17565 [Myxococcota bacterium]|nr:hypothetical protein [Myxococcota bacterium]
MPRFTSTSTAALTLAVSLAPALAHALPSVKGGADRGDFTVAGHLAKNAAGGLAGRFMIVLQPQVPGDTLAVSCTYTAFSNFSVIRNVASFDATGRCIVLDDDGMLPSFAVSNHFTITDLGPGPDLIDVNMYGAVGIAVPGGAVSFGDFAVSL